MLPDILDAKHARNMPESHPTHLTADEQRTLKDDGFVVLRGAVSRDLTARAKALINDDPSRIVHGDNPAINGLYNDSALRELMLATMGPHTAR